MEIQTTNELMRRYATMEGHVKKFNEQKWVDVDDVVAEINKCLGFGEYKTTEKLHELMYALTKTQGGHK